MPGVEAVKNEDRGALRECDEEVSWKDAEAEQVEQAGNKSKGESEEKSRGTRTSKNLRSRGEARW